MVTLKISPFEATQSVVWSDAYIRQCQTESPSYGLTFKQTFKSCNQTSALERMAAIERNSQGYSDRFCLFRGHTFTVVYHGQVACIYCQMSAYTSGYLSRVTTRFAMFWTMLVSTNSGQTVVISIPLTFIYRRSSDNASANPWAANLDVLNTHFNVYTITASFTMYLCISQRCAKFNVENYSKQLLARQPAITDITERSCRPSNREHT